MSNQETNTFSWAWIWQAAQQRLASPFASRIDTLFSKLITRDSMVRCGIMLVLLSALCGFALSAAILNTKIHIDPDGSMVIHLSGTSTTSTRHGHEHHTGNHDNSNQPVIVHPAPVPAPLPVVLKHDSNIGPVTPVTPVTPVYKEPEPAKQMEPVPSTPPTPESELTDASLLEKKKVANISESGSQPLAPLPHIDSERLAKKKPPPVIPPPVVPQPVTVPVPVPVPDGDKLSGPKTNGNDDTPSGFSVDTSKFYALVVINESGRDLWPAAFQLSVNGDHGEDIRLAKDAADVLGLAEPLKSGHRRTFKLSLLSKQIQVIPRQGCSGQGGAFKCQKGDCGGVQCQSMVIQGMTSILELGACDPKDKWVGGAIAYDISNIGVLQENRIGIDVQGTSPADNCRQKLCAASGCDTDQAWRMASDMNLGSPADTTCKTKSLTVKFF